MVVKRRDSVVFNLASMGAPKVLLGIVLLLGWTSNVDLNPKYTMVEYFAGKAHVSNVFNNSPGHRVASYEINDSRSMDFLSAPGFVLAIVLALQSCAGALHLMAPVCGSWTRISRGSSLRSSINCFGDMTREFVATANCMISRLAILMLVSLAVHAVFLCDLFAMPKAAGLFVPGCPERVPLASPCAPTPDAEAMRKNYQGDQLAEIFKKEGHSFSAMEVKVKQLVMDEEKNEVLGGWHTDISLKKLGWTESMIGHAKQWAMARNLCRKNEVHGEDEFKIPTDSNYSFTNTRRKEAEGSGTMEVEDPNGTLLEFGDLSAEQAMLRGSNGEATNSVAAQSAAAAKLASLPMVHQNQDPYCYISQYIDEMGKKMDKIDEQKVYLPHSTSTNLPRMLKQLANDRTNYFDVFDKLVKFQEASCGILAPTEAQKSELRDIYVECTKMDVRVNNMMSRARALKSSKPKAKAKSSASKPLTPAPKRKVSSKRPAPVEPVAPDGEEPSVSTSRPSKKAKKAKATAKK
ncbi:unnamed protein product [Cladocopium goreaui]|uniref:Uncharacterized protein n=1 Tax=Cladocopium goreaui TaxID=2562237 RepID=A0A9P1GBW3_9DINO|nr:unnamed protein product [Cladocopium goreaui]